MRRRTVIIGLGVLPAVVRRARALGSASEAPPGPTAPLRVVASFSILADMVREIGGGTVSVESLVGPDGDAHVYEPRPRDLRTLVAAGLLVRNGLGLEGWMERLSGAAAFKGQVVIAAEKVVARTMKDEGGAISTDPHAWQDPRNAELYVQAIAAGLILADPAHADAYREAAREYAARIVRADSWIETTLATIPAGERRIITTHDAFGYYGARYGVEFLSAEGISTESEPSAKTIAALVQQIRRERVHAVFIENMTSPKMAQMLARETGALLGGTVYSDALSPPGGPAPTYLRMLRHNTRLFAAALSPRG